MRIGLLASTGGMLDSFFTQMTQAWRSHGHFVNLAAGTPTVSELSTVIAGLTRRPDPRMIRAVSELRGWAEREELDVIVTNSATASGLVRTAGTTAPVVYFCHGLHWNEARSINDRLWQVIETILLRRTAGVISINSDDQRWFNSRIGASRHLHLSSGVGLDLIDYPAVCQPSGRLRLCWIGEFSSRKRPHLALDTAEELQRNGIDFHLDMLGEGRLRSEICAKIRQRGLDERVTAAGTGAAAEALSASHALLHTSKWEGLPRVMLEALAIGRRSYAFDVKGVRDIPASRLTPDGRAQALAALIAEDWASGRLRESVEVDRDALDFSHAADEILRFLLAVTASGPDAQSARGDFHAE